MRVQTRVTLRKYTGNPPVRGWRGQMLDFFRIPRKQPHEVIVLDDDKEVNNGPN